MNNSKIQREIVFDPLTDYHSCNLQVREEYMLTLSQNSVVKKIFGPDGGVGGEVTGHWKKNCILRRLIISAAHQIYV